MAQEPFPMADLCMACGFCCIGVVHSRALLDADEIELAQELGLRVDVFEDGTGFHLPCPQYRDGKCAAYQRRPRVCVNYQCELLQRCLAGQVALEEALSLIAQAKAMLGPLWDRLPGGKATPITFETLRQMTNRRPR
jgi:Fe-S-cluster containining protein